MNSSVSSSFPSAFRLPPAVNLHFWKPCNLRCKFCFATFGDDAPLKAVRGGLPLVQWLAVLDGLKAAGAEKINFVGGEPTLCPYFPALLRHTRNIGCVCSMVTNGAKLKHVLAEAPGCVDWVGLSVDSAVESTQAALGRGTGGHVRQSIELFDFLHQNGIRTKLNSVVTSLNWEEDMTEFVVRCNPERWKAFQVLPVEGQNDGKIADLLITPEKFESFVTRHRAIKDHGIDFAPESNDDMTESYAMIDPLGRFFSNAGGRYAYSQPILEVGVEEAFHQVQFSPDKFEGRGGRYDWGGPVVSLTVSARS